MAFLIFSCLLGLLISLKPFVTSDISKFLLVVLKPFIAPDIFIDNSGLFDWLYCFAILMMLVSIILVVSLKACNGDYHYYYNSTKFYLYAKIKGLKFKRTEHRSGSMTTYNIYLVDSHNRKQGVELIYTINRYTSTYELYAKRK